MTKQKETVLILQKAQRIWKKRLGFYLIFSSIMALVSAFLFYFGRSPFSANNIQAYLSRNSFSFLFLIVGFVLTIFPRIGLMTVVEAEHRGKKYGMKDIWIAFRARWTRVILASTVYFGLLYMIIIYGAFTSAMRLRIEPLLQIGIIAVAALFFTWLGIRLLLLPYTALLSPDQPLIRYTFRLTKGWFWTILRLYFNTFFGWHIAATALLTIIVWSIGWDSELFITGMTIIFPIMYVFITPYQTAAEIVLYRRCETMINEIKSQPYCDSLENETRLKRSTGKSSGR